MVHDTEIQVPESTKESTTLAKESGSVIIVTDARTMQNTDVEVAQVTKETTTPTKEFESEVQNTINVADNNNGSDNIKDGASEVIPITLKKNKLILEAFDTKQARKKTKKKKTEMSDKDLEDALLYPVLQCNICNPDKKYSLLGTDEYFNFLIKMAFQSLPQLNLRILPLLSRPYWNRWRRTLSLSKNRSPRET